MCFDICTINIRVSIRVRELHLVWRSRGYLDGKMCRFAGDVLGKCGALGSSRDESGGDDSGLALAHLAKIHGVAVTRPSNPVTTK